MQTIDHPILFVGGGNMANAILSGSSTAGVLDPSAVGVIEPNQDRHQFFKNAFSDAQQAESWLGSLDRSAVTILLAIKPQMLIPASEPLQEILARLSIEPLVISILAGTRIEQIRKAFKNRARVIRVMPNTPALVRLGMSAISPSEHASDEDIELAQLLFSSFGKAIEIPEEQMDAFTALAGSGPAYIFYLGEAMTRAAQELGFSTELAQIIVRQTILGSAALLDESTELASTLRNRVTSKNGTTSAATTLLDDSGVMDAIVRAIHAAKDRGVELGKESP